MLYNELHMAIYLFK